MKIHMGIWVIVFVRITVNALIMTCKKNEFLKLRITLMDLKWSCRGNSEPRKMEAESDFLDWVRL